MRNGPPHRPPRREAPHQPAADQPIRIALAMQARLDREGLAALLRTQPDFELVGSVATSRLAIELCVRERPRVLLLGALLAWPPGVTAYPVLALCSPATRVLLLAPHTAERCAVLNPVPDGDARFAAPRACVTAALAHGAGGALHRDAGPDELFAAIRTVAQGGRWIGTGLPPAPRELPLSRRERAVSRLVGAGNSNKEIATALRISEGTVKKHVGHVLHKLSLHDRLQLGLCVARHRPSFDEAE